jgi:hypothetical protein
MKVQGKSSLGLDLNGVPMYKIIQIHESMGEYLMYIDEMENENLTLKEKNQRFRERSNPSTYIFQPNY